MSTTNEDGGEIVPHCWICHEEGTNELGEPLRRDCSCRGFDAGYAHLSCLVEYAKHQTNQWDRRSLSKLRKIWKECPSCKQPFQHKLGVELVTEFLSYVETNYSDDQRMNVTALYHKMVSLVLVQLTTKKTPQTRQEIKDIANKIFSMFEQMKSEEYPLLNRVQRIEPKVYNSLGRIALKEGTKDSVQEALAHFEKCRGLCILLGLTATLAIVERNIIVAKELCGEVISIEKKVELSQKLYDMRLKVYGVGALYTLNDGKNLAKDLLNACRLAEAESLLSNLATVSKQVHGLDHTVTKSIKSVQRDLRKRKSKADHSVTKKLRFERCYQQQSERRTIYILPTNVSVFLLCWHLLVMSLSGLIIILSFGMNTLRAVRDVLVRVHGSEHINKQLNRVLFLSIMLASILSMYKISYGVSVVLSGGVTSLYLL